MNPKAIKFETAPDTRTFDEFLRILWECDGTKIFSASRFYEQRTLWPDDLDILSREYREQARCMVTEHLNATIKPNRY